VPVSKEPTSVPELNLAEALQRAIGLRLDRRFTGVHRRIRITSRFLRRRRVQRLAFRIQTRVAQRCPASERIPIWNVTVPADGIMLPANCGERGLRFVTVFGQLTQNKTSLLVVNYMACRTRSELSFVA
jgi:hypothetical protein